MSQTLYWMTITKVQKNSLYCILINSSYNRRNSDPSEHFPPQIKLQLLQDAARPIEDLRIVETLDEFQSITTCYGTSSSLKYQIYYDLLINVCVRYDRKKKANIAKRRHIYQTSFNPDKDGFSERNTL